MLFNRYKVTVIQGESVVEISVGHSTYSCALKILLRGRLHAKYFYHTHREIKGYNMNLSEVTDISVTLRYSDSITDICICPNSSK